MNNDDSEVQNLLMVIKLTFRSYPEESSVLLPSFLKNA